MRETRKSIQFRLAVFGMLVLLLASFAPASAVAAVVKIVETKTGVTVHSNDKVSIDASNLDEGYLIVRYTGGKDVKIKAQVAKKDGSAYTYDINAKGNPEVIPLTEGEGKYTIGVFENVSGTKYAQAYSVTVDVKLRDEFLPFLYPNQYVNYNPASTDSKVNARANELAAQAEKVTSGTLEMNILKAIYDDVTASMTYDTDLAQNVQPGYLPNVEKVWESKKGICFDYAEVMSSMLRLKGIPSKLVIGYAGTVYHAWINVYIDGEWLDHAIFWNGKQWSLLDPTFVSTAKSANAVKQFIGEGNSYSQKYMY